MNSYGEEIRELQKDLACSRSEVERLLSESASASLSIQVASAPQGNEPSLSSDQQGPGASLASDQKKIAGLETELKELRAALSSASIRAKAQEEANAPTRRKLISDLTTSEKAKIFALIQRLMRGFLGRRRVMRLICKITPSALMPCPGTTPGQSGWYERSNSFYYFCKDGEAFIAVCGPVTSHDIQNAKISSKSSKNKLLIEASAIYACKTQLDSMLEKFESAKSTSKKEERRNSRTNSDGNVQFTADTVEQDYDKRIKDLQRQLKDAQKQKVVAQYIPRRKMSSTERSKRLVMLQSQIRKYLAWLKVSFDCER